MEITKGTELELAVEELSSDGKGVARTESGFVVFVAGALPGDRATVKVQKKKSAYAEAVVTGFIKRSPYITPPVCTHFGVCGGCKLQDLTYEKQADFKTGVVRNAIQRIGGFDFNEIPEAVQSPEHFFYRNKMEYSFSDDVWRTDPESVSELRFALGLHVPKFHSKIVNIDACYLQSELSNRILNSTRNFFLEKGADCYTTKTHNGLLRFLIIRQAKRTSNIMVNLITNDHDPLLMHEYKEFLHSNIPEVDTIVNGISRRKSQTAFADELHTLHGSGYITEILRTVSGREFRFDISPNSFFQTNILQCENLFNTAVEFAQLDKSDNVLDLYCGTGSISFYLSEHADSVTGVELINESVKDAELNAQINGVSNCRFIAADIKEFLEIELRRNEFSVAVLDPPRSGLHPRICELLSEAEFKRIVYVSCNPHTQARDLQIICSGGKYRIERIQPFDMFPHTLHVENVVSLIHV